MAEEPSPDVFRMLPVSAAATATALASTGHAISAESARAFALADRSIPFFHAVRSARVEWNLSLSATNEGWRWLWQRRRSPKTVLEARVTLSFQPAAPEWHDERPGVEAWSRALWADLGAQGEMVVVQGLLRSLVDVYTEAERAARRAWAPFAGHESPLRSVLAGYEVSALSGRIRARLDDGGELSTSGAPRMLEIEIARAVDRPRATLAVG